MGSITIKSVSYIKAPTTSVSPYYSTVESFREHSGFTNPSDFPESSVLNYLQRATEQIKKDGFYKIRWERVTKDSEDRYFTAKRWWGNRYGAASDNYTQIVHGTITKYDIEVYEADSTSSNAASLFTHGGRINKIFTKIPSDAITEVDELNGYFKLSSEYPTEGRQIFVTYYASGKPLSEISYELEMACNEWAMVLALRRLKDTRLYNGVVTFTSGRQTINRSEEEFDKLVKMHEEGYRKWINFFKPFIGKKVAIGFWETQPPRGGMLSNRY